MVGICCLFETCLFCTREPLSDLARGTAESVGTMRLYTLARKCERGKEMWPSGTQIWIVGEKQRWWSVQAVDDNLSLNPFSIKTSWVESEYADLLRK